MKSVALIQLKLRLFWSTVQNLKSVSCATLFPNCNRLVFIEVLVQSNHLSSRLCLYINKACIAAIEERNIE